MKKQIVGVCFTRALAVLAVAMGLAGGITAEVCKWLELDQPLNFILPCAAVFIVAFILLARWLTAFWRAHSSEKCVDKPQPNSAPPASKDVGFIPCGACFVELDDFNRHKTGKICRECARDPLNGSPRL